MSVGWWPPGGVRLPAGPWLLAGPDLGVVPWPPAGPWPAAGRWVPTALWGAAVEAALAASLAAVLAGALAVAGMAVGRPRTANYRGVRLPVVLGAALAGSLTVSGAVLVAADAAARGLSPSQLRTWGAFSTLLAVFAAGLYDDLQPGRTHGLLRHLGALAVGRATSGIVKLVVIVLAAGAAVLAVGGATPVRGSLGVLLVAGCANLWNLLDVAPGRALKLFLPALAGVGLAAAGHPFGLPATASHPYGLLAAAAGGAGVALLPFDLRERAMLGDSGSNVLGFVVGLGLYLSLPTGGLAAGVAAVVALHAAAETVTLSRVIRAVPPLRWLDGLGRVRPEATAEGPAPDR